MMMKKLIFILGMSAAISGCVPAVFVAGGAAGAAITGDNRKMQAISDDTDIAYRANNLIQADKELANKTHISVFLFNSVALMTGQAPTIQLKQRAEQAIKSLQGINQIYNQVAIAQPIGTFTRSNDALITANVKTRMLTTTDLKSNQFKIATENGTVYIMGLTTRKQADMAVNTARQSTGVKQVIKLIEYID